MEQLLSNSFVEIHDSTLLGAFLVGRAIEVRLRPAYLHHRGSGWTQDVDLVIDEGAIESLPANLPCDLADGSLAVGEMTWQNEIPLDLDYVGPVTFSAQTSSSEWLLVSGSSAKLVRCGTPSWVEDSPFDYNDVGPDLSEN